MPITINGIGTRYYGYRDANASPGVCEFCRRQAVLSNYSTSLFFTVLYVPLIPLGKKQIFSECGLCRKHRVMPLGQWRQIQSQTISAAQAAADAAPQDPAAAINLLHAQYACFQRAEAAETARALHERFPGNADVQMAVADCLDLCGATEQAERAYLTALQLEPDNLRAKRAVALGLIARQDPDSAQRLLAAPPAIDAAQNPRLFERLGQAFAAVGRHREALAVFQQALAAAPSLGNEREFRRRMTAAERAVGVEQSALPRWSLWRRRPVLAPVTVVAAVAGALLLANAYAAAHQTLHVVNGFDVPLTIHLDNDQTIEAPPRKHLALAMSEGDHAARVFSGRAELGQARFNIQSDLWKRFFGRELLVLNPGLGATLVEETVYFSNQGLPQPPAAFHIGELYHVFRNVDYPFVELPQAVIVPAGKVVKKTRVSAAPQSAAQIVGAEDSVAPLAARLQLAEIHLRVTPNDGALRDAYTKASARAGAEQRAAQFLASLPPP